MENLRLTSSERYYVSYRFKNRQTIDYFTLDKEPIPLAKAKCGSCKQIIKSKHCGHFVRCKCGKSFVDTDRWFPERHRFGGEAQNLNPLTPSTMKSPRNRCKCGSFISKKNPFCKKCDFKSHAYKEQIIKERKVDVAKNAFGNTPKKEIEWRETFQEPTKKQSYYLTFKQWIKNLFSS